MIDARFLTKSRTTLGRRTYNDILIDDIEVSGEHAVIQMKAGQFFIEDLKSTNGITLNGKLVQLECLCHNDIIGIGKHKIRYLLDDLTGWAETTAAAQLSDGAKSNPSLLSQSSFDVMPDTTMGVLAEAQDPHGMNSHAVLEVVSGATAGRRLPLLKAITTFGKLGVAVVSIEKRMTGFIVAHVAGSHCLRVNGVPLGAANSLPLKNFDMLELAGTRLQFCHRVGA